MPFRSSNAAAALLLATFALVPHPLRAAGLDGLLELSVVDSRTEEPLAARVHLRNSRGRPVRVPGLVQPGGYFVVDGSLELELPQGDYSFEMECGPEYKLRTGNFSIQRGAEDAERVVMERFVDMAGEGWYAGDLDVVHPAERLDALMRAEGLRITAGLAWHDLAAETEPIADSHSTRDHRTSGSLWYFRAGEPISVPAIDAETPSSAELLVQLASDPRVAAVAETPFAGDMPVWLASGRLHGVMLANRHLLRSGVVDHEAGGMPRDPGLFPEPHGNGRWSVHAYYQMLNAGLRVPPAAGSGSGENENPVGYNRVYVHCGEEFSPEAWWEGLRAGRVVVTNGPMLRPRANGELPGYVFTAEQGEKVELEIELNLATREKIDYLEIIRNGRVEHEVRLDAWAKAGGRLPPVTFEESGWLLVRAVTNNTSTYRYATSGPFYVEIGYEPRISRSAAQFFLDVTYRRARELRLPEGEERARVLLFHRAARDFWQRRVDAANAE